MKKTINHYIQLLVILINIIIFASCEKQESRQTITLSGKWDFAIDSMSVGESEAWMVNGLPSGLKRNVEVPHTWNAEKPLARYAGKAWYERKFEVSNDQLSKTTRLQFDAVYHDAFIYVNGEKAGEHLNSGYNRFFVDISPFIKPGENRLTVCVDNSFSRSNIPFMKSYDWAHDGGIYRNVYEVITEKQAIRNIHITATPENGKGVTSIKFNFIDPNIIDPSNIELFATVTEENQATQNVVYSGLLKGSFENGSFVSELTLDDVNLWHFDEPNLYKLEATLKIDRQVKDQYSSTFGFRTIKIENNRYVLNGEPMRLMGVEWMPGSTPARGMAETLEDFEGHLKLMKNANCIFTRFHWQQDEYIFDWCDRNGILVQEEIPYWGIWTILNDTLLPVGFQHLNEMIDNHFNHPSIVSWGIGNELLAHESLIKSGLNQLYEHAKSMDPSRLSNYVTNSLHFDMPSENPERYDATYDFDMIMFNEYYSTHYKQTIDVISDELDRLHNEYPDKPMTISEWGLCDPPQPGGDERRNIEMVQQLEIYGSKPYIAGAIYFCLNDYRTQRSEDYSKGYPIRDHGVCDEYQNKKKSYITLQLMSSPIEVKNIERTHDKIKITLHGKTGIPSYIVRNYSLTAGSESYAIKELHPGDKKIIEIKPDNNEFKIIRPTGFEVLHMNL